MTENAPARAVSDDSWQFNQFEREIIQGADEARPGGAPELRAHAAGGRYKLRGVARGSDHDDSAGEKSQAEIAELCNVDRRRLSGMMKEVRRKRY